jgi:UDP-N-acetylglucosamine acyltransferase
MSSLSTSIHPSAIISDGAILEEGVSVGPFCVIGPNAHLAKNVRLISHVCVDGHTTIGESTEVYPFASIGHRPQDLKYHGEASTVVIGANTTIREYVTIQPGTEGGTMTTTVGDQCLLMVGVHVAHDCVVGNNVIMANYATLAGHVTVEDYVIIGGLSAVQQFVRIGSHAIIGGMSGVEKDVVPYAMIMGERAYLHGVNIVGLKRRGFSNQHIHIIQDLYQHLFMEESDIPFQARVQSQKEASPEKDDVIKTIFDFIDGDTKRSFCMPKKR